MLDMSRSMPLRGYFYAAKKVALALDSLIRSAYPRDTLHIIGFSDLAREIKPAALPHLSVNEYVYGTNMQHGLMLARRLLARDPGENKQIIIVSDGEPTAHIENGRPVFFYPPLHSGMRTDKLVVWTRVQHHRNLAARQSVGTNVTRGLACERRCNGQAAVDGDQARAPLDESR